MLVFRALLAAALMLMAVGCGTEPPCPSTDASPGDTAAAGPVYAARGNPYEPGELAVRTIDLPRCASGSPVPLQIHAPIGSDRYAVILFQHGFLLANSDYSELLASLAAHGFVVVAPQMYAPHGLPIGKPSTAEEAAVVVELLNWLPGHLSAAAQVTADATKLGIAGHSRGGKVAWLVLSGDNSRALAVAGVDPVDGAGGPLGNEPRVTQGVFSFALPSLIIGAGLESQRPHPELSCAPPGDNHEQFYAASPGPAWHVVAPQQGHLDMLNDNLADCGFICSFCSTGPDKAGMRRLTCGLLAAFFRAALQGDIGAYSWLTDVAAAPVLIQVASR